MLPVVALVGRPNVGKSTLFNRLTHTRDALVADFPGLTRDRQYGQASYEQRQFIVVDTGGITGDEEGIDARMAAQSLQAIEETCIHTGGIRGPVRGNSWRRLKHNKTRTKQNLGFFLEGFEDVHPFDYNYERTSNIDSKRH